MFPIFIPSKGRADQCLTAELLKEDGIPFMIVVEPQEYEEYNTIYEQDELLLLDENNLGLGYSRYFIKNYAKEKGYDYHWQIDDNVKRFMVRRNNKNIQANPKLVLSRAERYINQHNNIGIVGLRHVLYAWTMEDEYTFNNQCVSCVCLKSDTKANYRYNPPTVEDTDFSLQILLEGYSTVIFNRLIMEKPPQGQMKGGVSTLYNSGKFTQSQKQLIRQWPNIFELGMGKHKTKIKPSRIWQKFPQRPQLK